MLVISQLSRVPTTECLVSIWTDRYQPNLTQLATGRKAFITEQLRAISSQMERTRTAQKLSPNVVKHACKLAAVRAIELYANLSQKLSLVEASDLAKFAWPIYLKLIDVYQESPSHTAASLTTQPTTAQTLNLRDWGIPEIGALANTLEPLLLAFQEQHIVSQNWRKLGFITTQLNLTNSLLLDHLTPIEQVLITPYFRFLEEQVALPWQRICAAAADHELNAPPFRVVERMLPMASQISNVIYEKLHQSFRTHYSRSGPFHSPTVKHSCLRDLDMFQAYLWLCVLQGNLNAIEQELVPLCNRVFDSIRVPPTITTLGTKLLMEEILRHLEAQQQVLIRGYTEGMMRAFQTTAQSRQPA